MAESKKKMESIHPLQGSQLEASDNQAEDGVDMSSTDDEYAVQYFGFHPQAFMNGMYNAILEYLQEARTALNDAILSTFRDTVSQSELEQVSLQQSNVAVERLNDKFDKAEVYLNLNVFSIPPELVLPEDQVHEDPSCSKEKLAALDTDIQDVTDRIIAVKYANVVLRERLQEIEELQKQMDATLTTVDKLHSTVATESGDLAQSVRTLLQLDDVVTDQNLDTRVVGRET
ncbi:MIS12-like protein [Mya arenaria]|uniref:Protein MIS12 homolog n=1 Tax=Mya arenaria TaxID=6604 RepID=A0ABY7G619_MYAAR|nr:MIS12-like protein [Mya arenaria]